MKGLDPELLERWEGNGALLALGGRSAQPW